MGFNTVMQKHWLQTARMKTPLLFGIALLILLLSPTNSLADEPVRTFTGAKSVAFSPDGRYVLSGHLNNTLELWE